MERNTDFSRKFGRPAVSMVAKSPSVSELSAQSSLSPPPPPPPPPRAPGCLPRARRMRNRTEYDTSCISKYDFRAVSALRTDATDRAGSSLTSLRNSRAILFRSRAFDSGARYRSSRPSTPDSTTSSCVFTYPSATRCHLVSDTVLPASQPWNLYRRLAYARRVPVRPLLARSC